MGNRKPERKLVEGIYWEVNEAWIRLQIEKISNIEDERGEKRELIITPIKDCYEKIQTIFFSLNGSPPRGYAILKGLKYTCTKLCFISWSMNKKRTFDNIKLEEKLEKKLKDMVKKKVKKKDG